MGEATGVCVGCFRTIEEITAWGGADDGQRLKILAAVEHRRRDLDPWGEQLRGDCGR